MMHTEKRVERKFLHFGLENRAIGRERAWSFARGKENGVGGRFPIAARESIAALRTSLPILLRQQMRIAVKTLTSKLSIVDRSDQQMRPTRSETRELVKRERISFDKLMRSAFVLANVAKSNASDFD